MSPDSESSPNSVPAVTASRFDRRGVIVYNLALRMIGSPGAAWYATIAAFSATAERVPADAPAGIDEQDLLLMGCWQARQLLAQLEADPAYAAQLQAHDAALAADPPPAVLIANDGLPVDQRELLAINGLSGLDHPTLAGLLHADPGLLAAMVGEARLLLHDLLRGESRAAEALAGPEDRQAIALAALRQDGQLDGTDAAHTLDGWLDADPAHRETDAALDDAAQAYRAWPLVAVPVGLRDAVVTAVGGVAAPADATDADAGFPAGEHDRPLDAEEPFDPSATVEWSSSDIAALGLEGAPVRAAGRRGPVVADAALEDAGWGGGGDAAHTPPSLRADRERERAPRWHIALVGVLFVAVVIVLILTFTSKDDPTPATVPTQPTTTSPTPKRSSTSKSRSTTQGAVRLPHATVRITL